MEYSISTSSFEQYPVDIINGEMKLHNNNDYLLEIPKQISSKIEWGEMHIPYYDIVDYEYPIIIDVSYLSLMEKKVYSIKANTSYCKNKLLKTDAHFHIIIGLAPYGGVAIWNRYDMKSYLIDWIKAYNDQIALSDVHTTKPTDSVETLCNFYVNRKHRIRENFEKNGLPPRDLFDNYMKQFTYRYQVVFGLWDEEIEEWLSDDKVTEAEEAGTVMPELDYIEEALYDGTHDKLHDGGLMNYHEAGKPKKLAIKWHIKKSEYTAYFWFEDEEIRAVYDRFYGAHPDTKTDFMIRIDSEKNKYELALYRYGLRQPQVIAEKTYQLLVFRNKFECFRSENYNQERGAWIW